MPNQPDPKSSDHGGDADSRRRDAAGVLAPGLLAETYVVFFYYGKTKVEQYGSGEIFLQPFATRPVPKSGPTERGNLNCR